MGERFVVRGRRSWMVMDLECCEFSSSVRFMQQDFVAAKSFVIDRRCNLGGVSLAQFHGMKDRTIELRNGSIGGSFDEPDDIESTRAHFAHAT